MEQIQLYGNTELFGAALSYYIITEQTGKEPSASFGIRASLSDGGADSVETSQINNLFCRKEEAERFSELLLHGRVTPVSLRDVAEDYIAQL